MAAHFIARHFDQRQLQRAAVHDELQRQMARGAYRVSVRGKLYTYGCVAEDDMCTRGLIHNILTSPEDAELRELWLSKVDDGTLADYFETDLEARETMLTKMASPHRAEVEKALLESLEALEDDPRPLLRDVEDEFVFVFAAAFDSDRDSRAVEEWYVLMLSYLAQAVDRGTIRVLRAEPLFPHQVSALVDWLLDYYGSWTEATDEAQALEALGKDWRRVYQSRAALEASLPPTTFASFAEFEATVDRHRTAARARAARQARGRARPQPQQPPPETALPPGWVRMRSGTPSHPFVFLGPHGTRAYSINAAWKSPCYK
jgi:hypothetical protein